MVSMVYWGPMAAQSLSGCNSCLTTGNWVEEDGVGEEVAELFVEEGVVDEDRLGLLLTPTISNDPWKATDNHDNAEHADMQFSMHFPANQRYSEL